MIFYFSGTGNSLMVAEKIGAGINTTNKEKLISIADELKSNHTLNYTLADNEKIGFVFPVYGWSVPTLVQHFIAGMHFKNYQDNYIYTLYTCGTDAGCTAQVVSKLLLKNGVRLNMAMAIPMPENYITFFDLDQPEIAQKKLSNSFTTIDTLVKKIKNKDKFVPKTNFFDWCKTYLVNPVFLALFSSAKPYYATSKCTGCGLCADICPVAAVQLINNEPKWHGKCLQCMGCINRCPQGAIEYGKKTQKKGRYYNPYCQNIDTQKAGDISAKDN